ncbi:MAG: hypothetical protein Q7P63_01855 [Verrucomicrobiota bacterium JB022]|nr:hypothetical protein [Verrucomicrobiota bacterium JB022]
MKWRLGLAMAALMLGAWLRPTSFIGSEPAWQAAWARNLAGEGRYLLADQCWIAAYFAWEAEDAAAYYERSLSALLMAPEQPLYYAESRNTWQYDLPHWKCSEDADTEKLVRWWQTKAESLLHDPGR